MKVFILSLDKEVVECFDSMEKVDEFLKEEWFTILLIQASIGLLPHQRQQGCH